MTFLVNVLGENIGVQAFQFVHRDNAVNSCDCLASDCLDKAVDMVLLLRILLIEPVNGSIVVVGRFLGLVLHIEVFVQSVGECCHGCCCKHIRVLQDSSVEQLLRFLHEKQGVVVSQLGYRPTFRNARMYRLGNGEGYESSLVHAVHSNEFSDDTTDLLVVLNKNLCCLYATYNQAL